MGVGSKLSNISSILLPVSSSITCTIASVGEEALRSKENKDYQAAKVELEQALTALTEAIKVLEEGTSMLLAKKTPSSQ